MGSKPDAKGCSGVLIRGPSFWRYFWYLRPHLDTITADRTVQFVRKLQLRLTGMSEAVDPFGGTARMGIDHKCNIVGDVDCCRNLLARHEDGCAAPQLAESAAPPEIVGLYPESTGPMAIRWACKIVRFEQNRELQAGVRRFRRRR
jgi:hypothetical protein